jgi:hypothetical protein
MESMASDRTGLSEPVTVRQLLTGRGTSRTGGRDLRLFAVVIAVIRHPGGRALEFRPAASVEDFAVLLWDEARGASTRAPDRRRESRPTSANTERRGTRWRTPGNDNG